MTNSQVGLPSESHIVIGTTQDRMSEPQQTQSELNTTSIAKTDAAIGNLASTTIGSTVALESKASEHTNDTESPPPDSNGVASTTQIKSSESAANRNVSTSENIPHSLPVRRMSDPRSDGGGNEEEEFDDEDDNVTRQGRIVEKSPKGRYMRFNERLGEGAFKRVYRAYDSKTGVEVAWNTVKLSALKGDGGKRTLTEMRILQSLNHPNIIQFYGSWVKRETQSVVFITELISGGTLRDFMLARPTKLRIMKRWCRNLLDALDYLHGMSPPIIHRDLKCDNVFINLASGDLRLGDLGLASWERNGDAKSVLGTPEYMAPELYDEQYDEKVDIYAFGLCVLEMITKLNPYRECTSALQIMRRVTSNIPPLAFTDLLDGPHKDFIGMCILPPDEGNKRPSCKELLQSPFLHNVENFSENQEDASNIDCLKLLKQDSELWNYIEEIAPGTKQRTIDASDVPIASNTANATMVAAAIAIRERGVNVPETISEEDQEEETGENGSPKAEANNLNPSPSHAGDLTADPPVQPKKPVSDFESKSERIFANGNGETVTRHGKIPSVDPKLPVLSERQKVATPTSPSALTYEPSTSVRSTESGTHKLPAPPTSSCHAGPRSPTPPSIVAPALSLERRASNSSTEEECNNGWSIKAKKTEVNNILDVTLTKNRDGQRTKVRFEFNIVTESPHATAAELVKDLELPVDELGAIEEELVKFCKGFEWSDDSALKVHSCHPEVFRGTPAASEVDSQAMPPPPAMTREASAPVSEPPPRSISPLSVNSVPPASRTQIDPVSRMHRRSTAPESRTSDPEKLQAAADVPSTSSSRVSSLEKEEAQAAQSTSHQRFMSQEAWDQFIEMEEQKANQAMGTLQQLIESFKTQRQELETQRLARRNEASARIQSGVAVAKAAAAVARNLYNTRKTEEGEVRRIRRGSSKLSILGTKTEGDEPKTKEQLRQEAKEKSEAEKIARKQQSKREAENLEAQLFTEFAETSKAPVVANNSSATGMNPNTLGMGASNLGNGSSLSGMNTTNNTTPVTINQKQQQKLPGNSVHVHQPTSSATSSTGSVLTSSQSFTSNSTNAGLQTMASPQGMLSQSNGMVSHFIQPPPSIGQQQQHVNGFSGQSGSQPTFASFHSLHQQQQVQVPVHQLPMNDVQQLIQPVPSGTQSNGNMMFNSTM